MYQSTGPQRRPGGTGQPNTVTSIRTPSGNSGNVNVVNSSGNPMQQLGNPMGVGMGGVVPVGTIGVNVGGGPSTGNTGGGNTGTGGTGGGGGTTPGPNTNTTTTTITSRVPDMLEQIKVEFEAVLQQLNIQRIEREDIEQKVRNQVNEVNDMAQQFRNLEALHRRIKMQYEDDIARLRHQLHESQMNMNQQQAVVQAQAQVQAQQSVTGQIQGSTTGQGQGVSNSPSMIPPTGPGNSNTTQQGSLHVNQGNVNRGQQQNQNNNNRINVNAITSRSEEITNLPKLLSRNSNTNNNPTMTGNTSPSLRMRTTQQQQQQQQQNNSNMVNLTRRSDDPVIVEGKASPPPLHLQSVSASSSSRVPQSSVGGPSATREMEINTAEGSTDISSDSLTRPSKRPSGATSMQQPLKRLNVGNRNETPSAQDEVSPKQSTMNRNEKTEHENGEFANDHSDSTSTKSEQAQETNIKAEPGSPSSNDNSESLSRHSKVKWMISYNTRASSYPETDRPHVVKKHMLDHQSVVCCVRFSNDGRYVASGCHKTAQVYDVGTGQQVFTVKRPQIPPAAEGEDAYVRAVCFSPDGTKLIAGMPQNTIRIWDIATKNEVQSLAGHESEIYSLDYVNDVIASGSGDRKVKLWDARNGSCLTTFGNESSGPTDGVTSVALSPDGTLLASASLDKIVRIWNTETSQLVDRLEGHNDSVYSIAFSPDGKNIISGSLDRTLMLWNVSGSGRTTSRPNLLFQGHKDFVLSVAYAPDGRWLMSGSKDRTVVFWDPRSTRSVLTVSGYRNSVISVASSPASPHFATGSGDCFACIWDYSCQPI